MTGGRFESDADDERFFLSPNGRDDPQAELLASLAALSRPGGGDRHPQCRFPARYHWLRSRLGISDALIKPVDCPGFREWHALLKAEGVTLVFPGAYMNSPSSMFGHTFLRLDQAGQNPDNVLLAYTINYAADTVDENELFYAYRGLFGGYPGMITVRPYYDKLKEYRDWENRDIWEYRLNLGKHEVEQLLRHTWEIKPIRFDYFFVGENCSYRLLSLLDVARPGLGLRHGFAWQSIPVDTVRAVIDAGLLREARYRPSSATTLEGHGAELPPEQRELAKQIAAGNMAPESPRLRALPARERAGILEVAYEFKRYESLAEKLPRESVATSSLALLRARSRISAPSPFKPIAQPDTRDDQGHRSSAATAGFGFYDRKAYGELRLRNAYHDLTDPWPGYRPGAQIGFLDGTLRYYESGGVKLERFDAVTIRSISPRDEFLTPLSWGVQLGATRRLLRNGRPLVGQLAAEVGFAHDLAGGTAFALAGATFQVGGALPHGVDIGFGPRLGWLYQGLGGQGLLSFSAQCYLVAETYCGGKLGLRHTVNLDHNLALNFDISRERGQDRYANEIGLSLQQYF
jgi:hypothetical protein